MTEAKTRDEVQRIVYRFMTLSYVSRMEILDKLGIIKLPLSSEEQTEGESLLEAFRKIKKEGLIDDLDQTLKDYPDSDFV